MYFFYENGFVYPVYISKPNFEDCMDLLLIDNENKSRNVYIKNFSRFMFNKTKCKNEKDFCKCYLECFSIERILMEHRKICLEINGKQSVKLESGTSKFKSFFKKIAVQFKTYADFEAF